MQTVFNAAQSTFSSILSPAIAAIFIQNIIFTRALGTSASLFVIRKKYNLWLFGLIMTVITTLSSILVYFIDWITEGWTAARFMTPFLYVLAVGIVYICILLLSSTLLRSFNEKLKPMIHLCAFNGAVFGALLLSSNYTLAERIGFGFGTGIGFILASYLLSLGYERLSSDRIPASFRGFPAMLIYTGILSLAFYGLIGHELSV